MAKRQTPTEQKRQTGQHRRSGSDLRTAGENDVAPHPLLTLQRQVGNAQVARMLAQRAAVEEEEELQMKRDPEVQRVAAEEEDELQMKRDPDVQRAAVEEEDELQMKRDVPEVGLEGGPVSDSVAGRIRGKKGGGSPLDDGTRATMESHFGTSLEDVRVHTDGESGVLNRSLGAKAFTTGSDIFLGHGASSGDRNLLAHELTHVVQQRSMSGSGQMTVGPAGDRYEQEADAIAARVVSGADPAQRAPDEE